MASIKDPHATDWFGSAMEEMRTKLLVQAFGEITETTVELSHAHKQFMRSAVDTCSKKCKDDEALFDMIQTYEKDIEQINVSTKEKMTAISGRLSEIEFQEAQKGNMSQEMVKLREENIKKRDLLLSQHKANKDRLKNLNKAKRVFEDRLGLEIRKIYGEKLQFIFQNIDPVNQDRVFTFIMGIKDNGSYQIFSSEPALERMSFLESRLQETNNISAFLANIRKEFVAQARV